MTNSQIWEHFEHLGKNPRLAIPGISDFFFGWLMTRRWVSLGLSFPVVLALLSSVLFAVYVRSQHREVMAAPFIKKMERQFSTSQLVKHLVTSRLSDKIQPLERGNSESTSELPLENLALSVRHAMGLDPTNQSLDFRYAIILDLMGEDKESRRILDRLAPPDTIRFIPAHAWKAVAMLSVKDNHQIDLERLEHHLKAAASWPEIDYRIYELASKIAEGEGQMRMALEYAKISADRQSDTLLRWAELADRLGKKTERKEALDKGCRHFATRMSTEMDQTEARIGLATCQKMLDRTNDACNTLRAGLELSNGDKPRLRKALVDILLIRHRKEVDEEKDLTSFQPSLLNEAASLLPLDPNVGEATAKLLMRKGKLDDSEPCASSLKRLIAEGSPTSRTHYYLGQVYFNKGQFSNAIQQGQQALAKDPLDQDALIMVANSALKTAPPNPILANEMVERAMAKETKNAAILELQGDVSHANGDLQKAAQAWEAALKMDTANNGLHRKLYDSYRKLGLVDEAEHHKPFLKEAAEESAPGLTSRK